MFATAPKIQISQTADFHFANYRFSFRKLQIFISQTTDFHFANYRFSFRFVPFRFVSLHFVSQTTVSLSNEVWRFYFKMEKVPNFQLFSHQKSPIGLNKLALILDEIEQKAQVKNTKTATEWS